MAETKHWISHRGNISGPNKARENNPDYIIEAIEKGFDVLIDVWFVDGNWFLGTLGPQINVNLDFLTNPSIWCHAQNAEALQNLEAVGNGIRLFKYDGSIVMLPEKVEPSYTEEELKGFPGMCSNYVYYYKATYLAY